MGFSILGVSNEKSFFLPKLLFWTLVVNKRFNLNTFNYILFKSKPNLLDFELPVQVKINFICSLSI